MQHDFLNLMRVRHIILSQHKYRITSSAVFMAKSWIATCKFISPVGIGQSTSKIDIKGMIY